MKKGLIIGCLIIATLLVGQNVYAVQGTFNITVTIGSYTMALRDITDTNPYPGWNITLPLGGQIVMKPNDCVLVKIENATQPLDIVTRISNSGGWQSVDYMGPTNVDEFRLKAEIIGDLGISGPDPIMMSNPKAITSGTMNPLTVTDQSVLIAYALDAPITDTTGGTQTIEVMVESLLPMGP